MTKNTEVATTNQNAVANMGGMAGFGAFKASNQEVVGLEALNSSDMKLPKVKLMQQTSLEVSKSKGKIVGGQFLNTITNEVVDELECILLDMGKSMVMWKKPFKRGEEPLCRSFDGKRKTEGCGDGACERCQYSSQNPAAWKAAEAKGEKKPECNMSYVWLALDAKTKMPFRIIMSGMNVSITKDFLNVLAPLRISPFCAKVTLKSKQEENESGVFYVVEYSNLRPNEELLDGAGNVIQEKYNELLDQSKAYKELFMTQIVANDVIDVDTTEENGNVNTANGALF